MPVVMGRLPRLVVLASSVLAAAVFAQAPSTNGTHGARPYTTWTAYGGGAHSSQYSALDGINKSNVSRLDVAWTFPVTRTGIFNPLLVDGVIFLHASSNTLPAVDAPRGHELEPRP